MIDSITSTPFASHEIVTVIPTDSAGRMCELPYEITAESLSPSLSALTLRPSIFEYLVSLSGFQTPSLAATTSAVRSGMGLPEEFSNLGSVLAPTLSSAGAFVRSTNPEAHHQLLNLARTLVITKIHAPQTASTDDEINMITLMNLHLAALTARESLPEESKVIDQFLEHLN